MTDVLYIRMYMIKKVSAHLALLLFMAYSPVSVVGLRQNRGPVTFNCDGMGSISVTIEALNVPLLLCHERLNKTSLPVS